MKILIACEFSGIVRDAFLKKGHHVISCDLQPTENFGPHYQGDVRDIVDRGWDMMIAHPPCTFLTVTANRWMNHPAYPNRLRDQLEAVEFVKYLYNMPIKKICIENPVGVLSTKFRKPDQYIQPFWFGDPAQKKTGLWLKNLPKLTPTNIVEPEIIRRENYSCPSWMMKTGGEKKYIDHPWHYGTSKKTRSRTFKGIAEALATQYTAFINSGMTVSEWENLLNGLDISRYNGEDNYAKKQ
jgi:hypothetical protein